MFSKKCAKVDPSLLMWAIPETYHRQPSSWWWSILPLVLFSFLLLIEAAIVDPIVILLIRFIRRRRSEIVSNRLVVCLCVLGASTFTSFAWTMSSSDLGISSSVFSWKWENENISKSQSPFHRIQQGWHPRRQGGHSGGPDQKHESKKTISTW